MQVLVKCNQKLTQQSHAAPAGHVFPSRVPPQGHLEGNGHRGGAGGNPAQFPPWAVLTPSYWYMFLRSKRWKLPKLITGFVKRAFPGILTN